MVNKTYSFGLLAAALILVPSAAFAGDQGSQQELNQSATAVGSGSRVNQHADQTSIQYQNQAGRGCNAAQSQGSAQLINQNGLAVNGSLVDQRANQLNRQTQIAAGRRHCF
jgi:hypothetical protein